jgi:hypothetical protein
MMDRMTGLRKREQIRGKKSTDELRETIEMLKNKQAEIRRKQAEKWLR